MTDPKDTDATQTSADELPETELDDVTGGTGFPEGNVNW